MRNRHNPAKAFLQRYRAALAYRQSLEREIISLRESLTGTTVQLKADVVSTSGSGDRMADTVARIADTERDICDAVSEASETLFEVLAAIRAVVDDTQRAVLSLRYVEGMGWRAICERMSYSETQIHVIHSRALGSVNVWLKGEYANDKRRTDNEIA